MIVFVTVFLSLHILPECKRLYELTNGKFIVIETKQKINKRAKYIINESLPFIKKYKDDIEVCNKLIREADVVIYAGTPNKIINNRIRQDKLTFISSERLFKRGIIKIFHYKLWKQIWSNILAYNKNTHLLCYGAFVGSDFATLGFSKKKMWKYGYFPKLYEHNITSLIVNKQSSVIKILWVGRIVCWKKLMEFVKAIKILRQSEPMTNFRVDIVGTGVKRLENKSKKFIQKNKLNDIVSLHGFKSNETVINMMKKADIFVSTSSRREGWGAVVNEAMGSGCAVVASNLVGCAGYLINDEENGLIYQSGKPFDLYKKLKYLICNKEKITKLGINAYYTIRDIWNGKVAAERLFKLINELQEYREPLFLSGPCSKEDL